MDDENVLDEEIVDVCGTQVESYDIEASVSYAPLHVAQPTRRWIPEERYEQLKQSFPDLKRGEWTKAERKILRKNWKCIKRRWPQFSDPKFAFGDGHDNEGKWKIEDIDRKRQEYKKFNVMLRMANKLDNRLLCDIYIRCRKRFYEKSFHFTSREDIPKALEKMIRNDLKLKESIKIISNKYNVAPSVVDTIKRRPRQRKVYRWSDESLTDLKLAVEFVHGDGGTGLLAQNINWKRVAEEMKKMRHKVDKSRCYNKWIRLNPNSVIKRHQQIK